MLSQRLTWAGIDNVILERKFRDYVLGRTQVGALETGTTQQMGALRSGVRMDAEGVHSDTMTSFQSQEIRLLTQTRHTVAGVAIRDGKPERLS